MAAAKAARRNNFTNELHLPNDPFQDPRIGRRTGVPLNIKARKDSHGFDNIDDYFPDSDPEEENVVPATQSSAQDCIVGRRTGVPLTIIARKDSHGFDNIDDYFPDSEPKQQNVVANGKSSAQDTIIERKAVNVNPTKDAEVFDNADGELANSGATNSKDLSPGEVEPADTPEENGESPNDTGTAIKNPASREPTPQLKGVIKKRLSFTNAKPLDESEKTQADCRDSPSHKNTDPTSEEIVESEIEIDVVDLSNDSNLIVEENGDSSSLAVTSKEKDTKQQQCDRNTKNRVDEDDKQQQRGRKRNAKNCIDENDKQQKQQRGHERNAKNRVDEEDDAIDVEGIEEDTFLTIGNNTMQIAKSSAAVGKSPVSSFIMSESFVLEGTRHKSMSPEFGASSDSQTEPDARAKKSKIPVRQKRLTNTKPAQQRATRGRKKKAVEEPQIVDTEEADADEKEDDKQRNRKEQIFSTRGRKEAAGKEKPVESEAVEVQNGGTDEKEERRATRLPSKRQQSKSARRGERKVTVSDQGDEGDESSAVGIEHGKKNAEGRKNTQKQNRITRGRKQKCDTENMDDGAAEVINVDNDGKKLSVHRTRPKEGVDDENKANRSEQPVECKTTEISGRKTRAQRKKEKEIEEKGEGKDIEVVVDDLKIEDVESENLGSLEMEKEIEKSERESRAKRKEKTKKNKENDGVENERNLTQAHSKSGGRKSQSFGRDKTLGEGDVQDLTEEVEDVSKVRGGLRGERGKPKVTEGREHDAEHEEKKDALDAIEDLADEQASSSEHVSVTNITNVSSNASSGSESTKKAITGTRRKRRKRPRILPPYAAKRLPSKGYNSKSSSAINSHDSMSETDAKKRRLQVEGNQTSIVEENSSRKGAVTNPRLSGRAKCPGRTSEVAMKSVAKSHENESPKRGRGVSGITVENANNDNVIDDAVSVAADDASVADSVQEATGVADNSRESVLLHRTDTMTPAQPVTALKSILKSGGSLGRAATVSRKRGKTPDKSHSGGSDADDESVLPAKQPNRKRLSTVSFASTPLVQESSSAPANRPSPGLSFVSKCSSYQSIDETFTPGSVRTVRSSGGSSGSSSAAESAINPEEEVTITSDARQPQDEQNTRRSKRTIVPPLQYWKNERIDYERRKSGGWCIKGIIKNPTPTPQHRRKPRQTKKSVVRTENNENAGDFSEEELVNQDLEGFQEITNPKGMVLHAENNEEVEMDIFHTPAMLNFTSPSGKPAQGDDPLIVHKFISQPLFGGGQVILRPEAEKGRQVVRNDTMVFYVIKGTVMVTVHQCSTVLHSGSTFFVPQGNSYNIKNLKKTDAKLMFVQIKG